MNLFSKAILAAIPFYGIVATSRAIELGDRLPNIEAVNQDNKKINLRQFDQESFLLIYFYPKADTPGCTAQACSLRDNIKELQKRRVKIIGVSTDKVVTQKNFQSKYQLPFELLSDEKGNLMKAFEVKRFPVLGLAQRESFLFHEGELIWVDRKATTKTHAQDILQAVTQIQSADKP